MEETSVAQAQPVGPQASPVSLDEPSTGSPASERTSQTARIPLLQRVGRPVYMSAPLVLAVYLAVFFYLQWGPRFLEPSAFPIRVDLIGHVVLHLTLGLLLAWLLRWLPAGARLGWLLAVGITTSVLGEWVQGFIPGRTPDVTDLAGNLVGVGLAALAASRLSIERPKEAPAGGPDQMLAAGGPVAPLVETRET